MKWLCFRALVEVLLGTGMQISEALSLKRSSINFQTGEATIIGKGNKERLVFFSPRSLNWVQEYVTRCQDRGEALFVVGRHGNALTHVTAHAWFRRFRLMIRFPKPVSAHMFRHTVGMTEASIQFHIEKNDYFGTLATVIDLVSQDLQKKGQTTQC